MEIRNNAEALKAFLGVSSSPSTQASQIRGNEQHRGAGCIRWRPGDIESRRNGGLAVCGAGLESVRTKLRQFSRRWRQELIAFQPLRSQGK